MYINLIIPEIWNSSDLAGYDEMLATEICALLDAHKIPHFTTIKYPSQDADLYIFVIQFRKDVFHNWLGESIQMLGNKLTLVCGRSASVEYKYILKNTKVDFVILGEVENTLIDFINQCERVEKKELQKISGLAYLKNEIIMTSPLRPAITNLDTLPFPKYEYLAMGYRYYSICYLRTARSCQGNCNFCENHIYEHYNIANGCRTKSAKRIFEELKYVIDTYGYRIFSFCNDNFFADGKKGRDIAIELANLIIQNKLKIRFTIECRSNNVEYDMFTLLKRAGLHKVFLGIESGSQSVLNRYRKGITVKTNRDALECLKNLGIICDIGYILFDPWTTKNELEETLQLLKEYEETFYKRYDYAENRKLYFPSGCDLAKKYWSNETNEFYEQLSLQIDECGCGTGMNYEFINEETSKLYDVFSKLMNDENKNKNLSTTQKTIHCLEKCLSTVN